MFLASSACQPCIARFHIGSWGTLARNFARKRKIEELPVPQFKKRLDCVIFGLPNVGKSILLNSLVKQKVAATCRKRHTTRDEILGVYNHRNTQLVLYDTPGYVGNRDELKKEMQRLRSSAVNSLDKSDVVLLVVDAARVIDHNAKFLFGEMARLALLKAKKEIILVLNKVDLVEPKTRLLEVTREFVSLINGVKLKPEEAHLACLDTTTFMISALKDDGVLDLKNYLVQIADVKPWLLLPEDGITTLSEEERVEEIVMEKLLENVHDEIPYATQITCTEVIHSPRVIKAYVEFTVIAKNHRKKIIGQHGETILRIRNEAVVELERIFGKTVLLYTAFNVVEGGGEHAGEATF